MRILERARVLEAAGKDIIHLEVGEPDFPTPEPVLAAARQALASQRLGYTPAAGLPQLREAIADYYRRRYRVELEPARIIVTPGGSGALQLALAAVLDVGETVLTPEPGYPCNRHIASLVGARPRAFQLSAEQGYRLTAADVAAAWQADVRAVMAASPSNPTGSVMSREALEELHQLVQQRGAALITDEIYQGLTYGSEEHTAACFDDGDVFVVNSFSKYFGMTGWRLGWLVAPPAFAETLSRLAQNLYLSAPTLSQHAALAALESETLVLLDQRRDAYRARRDVLVGLLADLGFEIASPPDGAFYLYARLPAQCHDAAALAERLLETAGVAVTPGIDFGGTERARTLRFAYTVEPDRLREAVARIASVMAPVC
jgi:aspartate/methionine/tyrosine aminotransferase